MLYNGRMKPVEFLGDSLEALQQFPRDAAGAFRVIYVARLAQAIFVLHCFEKKSRRTPASDIEIARKRYRQLVWRYR